ncbi:hypothetical protein FKW77_005049 [Venturia effusa]|uniref:Uncharacterized protein n=1 Tax=Venturia effusa TaxID=50376 RepID=A0A517LH52_9PEZI|nr:hypothetical protein FKW77_005049 [Venturia effusa]
MSASTARAEENRAAQAKRRYASQAQILATRRAASTIRQRTVTPDPGARRMEQLYSAKQIWYIYRMDVAWPDDGIIMVKYASLGRRPHRGEVGIKRPHRKSEGLVQCGNNNRSDTANEWSIQPGRYAWHEWRELIITMSTAMDGTFTMPFVAIC